MYETLDPRYVLCFWNIKLKKTVPDPKGLCHPGDLPGELESILG